VSALKLTIDADALTIGDMLDLEEATTVRAMVAWLVTHGGVSEADVRALPLAELKSVAEQVKAALAPGK